MTQALPRGCTIYTKDGNTHIRINGCEMLTIATGQKRTFKGDDQKTRERAMKACWRFMEGYDHDRYELER